MIINLKKQIISIIGARGRGGIRQQLEHVNIILGIAEEPRHLRHTIYIGTVPRMISSKGKIFCKNIEYQSLLFKSGLKRKEKRGSVFNKQTALE